MTRALLLLPALFVSFAALAQPTTPVLIPTFYNGPGQFGSQWRTDVVVVNGMEQSLEGRGVRFATHCPIAEGCETSYVAPSHRAQVAGPESARGLLLHLPANAADRVEFQGHFGEGDRRSYVLPIVRERDFRSDRFGMADVPFHGPFRSTLRIYSPDPLVDQFVIVRVIPTDAPFGIPEAVQVITLETDVPTSLPLRPAFAQLVLQRDFPQITGNSMRIELESIPRLDGRIPRIWAFVTVTFNDRNDVVVIVPQ
ncbi:MAG TPA: hypothetical protein VEK11_01265 [Thermoanaerobaculia bacterium]|jgi:hypothetical protein|nr:hypothetical protein [Thermoanaerobaculia bacterium]